MRAAAAQRAQHVHLVGAKGSFHGAAHGPVFLNFGIFQHLGPVGEVRQRPPAHHLFLRMLPQVPQQVVGHLGIARVAVFGFEGGFVLVFVMIGSVVAGLGQQAPQALLPEHGGGPTLAVSTGGSLVGQAGSFG